MSFSGWHNANYNFIIHKDFFKKYYLVRFSKTNSINKLIGCPGRTRTHEMSESESDALPLGYEAIPFNILTQKSYLANRNLANLS